MTSDTSIRYDPEADTLAIGGPYLARRGDGAG